MAFIIPSIKDLAQRARNAFRAELPGTDAWVWPNNIYVSAKVFAGIVYQLFMRLKWIDKQRFAMTATLEGLLMMGEEYGLPLKGATYAQGAVDVPAVFPYVVPAGTVFTRLSDSVLYVSTQEVRAVQYSNSSVLKVPVVCQTIGKIGNMIAGTPLSTTLTGLVGGATFVTVDQDGIGRGADVEDVESYRQRILTRKRQVPMGGALYDYEAWALEIPGVTRAFAARDPFGPGTVALWVFMDNAYVNGIPQPSDIANIQAYIDAKAPATANVFVMAAEVHVIDVIVNKLTPNTQAVRNAVAAELLALFQNMTRPSLPKDLFVLYHSWLEQAVGNATGEHHNEGVLQPATDITFRPGAIPVLGSVSFTPTT